MADLDELDERRATADSAHKAVLVIKGQSMQLTVDKGQLQTKNEQLQAAVKQIRGQALRDTIKAIGATTLKVGGVLLALWVGFRHF